MLSVVTFKWVQEGYHTRYSSAHVNTLQRMASRHYPHPFRFFCVTDESEGIDPAIEVIPLWHDHAEVRNIGGPHKVSCYRRLKLFSSEARGTFGERLVCLDLDVVILGDLSPLWDREEDFVINQDAQPQWYNGSMFLLTAGSRERAWTEFDPETSPSVAREESGHGGSDQAWLTHCLPGEATWGPEDGVLSYKRHVRKTGLSSDAKVVMFHGQFKPWGPEVEDLDWIREHYR